VVEWTPIVTDEEQAAAVVDGLRDDVRAFHTVHPAYGELWIWDERSQVSNYYMHDGVFTGRSRIVIEDVPEGWVETTVPAWWRP
jgi:hypothetical protein